MVALGIHHIAIRPQNWDELGKGVSPTRLMGWLWCDGWIVSRQFSVAVKNGFIRSGGCIIFVWKHKRMSHITRLLQAARRGERLTSGALLLLVTFGLHRKEPALFETILETIIPD